MRDKNGFTLVEILTVLGIIAILVIFIYGAGFNLLVNSKKELYKLQEKNLLDAGKLYMTDIDNNVVPYILPSSTSVGLNSDGNSFHSLLTVMSFNSRNVFTNTNLPSTLSDSEV